MAADSPEGPAPTMTTSRTDIRLMITKAGRQEGRKAGRMERRGREGGKAEGRRWKVQPSPFPPSNLSAVDSCPSAFLRSCLVLPVRLHRPAIGNDLAGDDLRVERHRLISRDAQLDVMATRRQRQRHRCRRELGDG